MQEYSGAQGALPGTSKQQSDGDQPFQCPGNLTADLITDERCRVVGQGPSQRTAGPEDFQYFTAPPDAVAFPDKRRQVNRNDESLKKTQWQTRSRAGLTARIGWDLDSGFGPPRIRPALAGAGEFIPGTDKAPWGGYAFIGVDGRAIARDMFLDGNLWRDSARVEDRRALSGDLQAGLVVHHRDVQVAFTWVTRTEQFAYQDGPQQFGAVSISIAH